MAVHLSQPMYGKGAQRLAPGGRITACASHRRRKTGAWLASAASHGPASLQNAVQTLHLNTPLERHGEPGLTGDGRVVPKSNPPACPPKAPEKPHALHFFFPATPPPLTSNYISLWSGGYCAGEDVSLSTHLPPLSM